MEHSNAVWMQTYWKIQKIKLINLENRAPAGKHIKTIQNELCERMWMWMRMRMRIEKAPAERVKRERETDMTQAKDAKLKSWILYV